MKIMTETKKALPESQISTRQGWEFHHKFISSKLAREKEHLIGKTKSPRGLTLSEKINLDEINFLISSGFDVQNEPVYVGKFDSVTRQKKILDLRDKHKSLTKAELLTKLVEAEVELEESGNAQNIEGKRFEFLLKYFDEQRQEKVTATKARQHGKKTSSDSIHVRQKKVAREIISEMKDYTAHGKDINGPWVKSFVPADFKVFCKKMRVTCKPTPSATTLRNYFLKMTGLSTTK